MRTHLPQLGRSSVCGIGSDPRIVSRAGILLCALGFSILPGCTSPQNYHPYPNYPAYPGYPPGYALPAGAGTTLPSGTTVPNVGVPTVGSAVAQPPVMGQPLPGSVPAYPSMAPGQPIPPGYTTGIPAR